ncbi:hypothetical protein EVAR_74018_1, partial [Eumeta japonica]
MTRYADPVRSEACFNYYIYQINTIAETYKNAYADCLQKSADDRSNADRATLNDRNKLADSVDSSCALLYQCREISSPRNMFECYITT